MQVLSVISSIKLVMGSKLFIIFKLLIFVAVASEYREPYKDFCLYEVIPKQVDQLDVLRALDLHNDVMFWESFIAVNQTRKVMVALSYTRKFEAILRSNRVNHTRLHSNVQLLIDEQKRRTKNQAFDWSAYMTLDEINKWLDELLDMNPDVVSLVTIGQSHEGRDLKGIIINFNHNKEQDNKTIIGVIEGTIHGREWMSAAVVTWIIKEFLVSTDEKIRRMADDIEWHIFPVINPDGYVYSFEKRRFWKKNRNTKYYQPCNGNGVDDDISNGVNLNRNFDIGWMAAESSSDNPCSMNFGGSNPFSEPESLHLTEYVEWKTEHTHLLYYIAIHQSQPMILIPYGHVIDGQTIQSPNYDVMYKAAIKGANMAKTKYKVEYKVGLAPNILYPTSSTSIDLMKYVTGAPRTFQIGTGFHQHFGYLIHPKQIIQTCQEVLDVLVEIDGFGEDPEPSEEKRYEHPKKYAHFDAGYLKKNNF